MTPLINRLLTIKSRTMPLKTSERRKTSPLIPDYDSIIERLKKSIASRLKKLNDNPTRYNQLQYAREMYLLKYWESEKEKNT